MKNNLIIITLFVFCYSVVSGQDKDLTNWHFKDLKKDKFAGISLYKAYNELLADRKSKTVIVAIIDSGTDTTHEDLIGKIWTNKNEIPGNGIDDDHNGYIDDIHGWSFLGNKNGENILYENLEVTRVFKELKDKFEKIDTTKLPSNELKNFEQFKKVRIDFNKRYNKAKTDYDNFKVFSEYYTTATKNIEDALQKKDFTVNDIKTLLNSTDANLKSSAEYIIKLENNGFTKEQFNSYKRHVETQYKYRYNTNYNARKIVCDNPFNNNDSIYGNNNVMGPSCGHGTYVAGVVGANRNNNNNAYGIADDVELMILRVVPDGDERDKDVANAIKYAANNGARVINMSFGKDYSPQKKFVDEAIKYASNKGVLLIHAAGNEAENSDLKWHFPINKTDSNNIITNNWIEVGASSMYANKHLPAVFSNYGQKNVDIFAPGVSIYSIEPGNKFSSANGTSSACPVVTGIAALIMSYFPELTALEVKEIILNSSTKLGNKKVLLPSKDKSKKTKTKFKQLSCTGGVVNAYSAVKMAIDKTENK